MAAGSVTVYSNAAEGLNKGSFDLASDTIVATLITSSYTPAVATDSTWANVSADEVASGSGYTQGGVALASQSVSLSSNTVTFSAGNVSWSTFSATFKYLVLVRRAGASLASTDLLLGYFDADSGGGSVTGLGGTLTVSWNASGIFTTTHSP